MRPRASEPFEERVLIHAPVGRDAQLIEQILERADFSVHACPDADVMMKAIRAGASALLLTEEGLPPAIAGQLHAVLDEQAPWSDLPIIVLVGANDTGDRRSGLLRTLESRANVTLIERPVRVRTLVATVQSAVRARRRQYEARDLLRALEKSASENARLLDRERDARAEAEVREQTLVASEKRFRAVFDQALDAMVLAEDDGRIVDVNPAACALFGDTTARLIGRYMFDFAPSEGRLAAMAAWSQFVSSGVQRGEMTIACAKGGSCVVEYTATANVVPGRHLSVMRDIEARKRAENSLRFLAEASELLGASLDYRATLAGLVQLAVPRVADIAAVDVIEPDGEVHRLGLAHRDAGKVEVVWDLWHRLRSAREARRRVPQVLRTGQPELIPDFSDAILHEITPDPTLRASVRELGIVSTIRAPIAVRGVTLGAITFVSTQAGRRFDATDLRLAEDLAHRTGLAIDNARTYGEARLANRMKDEFLATVSHELRTPLNAILGYASMLKAGAVPEERRGHALNTIERNARSQARLIEDLLDISRVISGKLRLNVRAVDPASAIQAALDAVRPAAEAKQIRLETDLGEGETSLRGDPDRLQQVIWNLVSNAIKFTPREGRVAIRLRRVDTHVEIVVEDNGQGIPADFLPYVFDRFRQADASLTRAHQGLGLGLAIARSLVELHGGSIRAESDGPSKGSRFVVRLPFSAAPASVPEPNASTRKEDPSHSKQMEPGSQLEGLRVLVVDDEIDARDLLALVLTRSHASVTTAASAADALRSIAETPPDLVVSDIGMPGEDGYSFIRRVRELPIERGGQTPAVALTSYARREDCVKALKAGFDMHVAKPVEPTELVGALAQLADRRSSR